MSLIVNNAKILDRKIHHNAQEDTVYLFGRILTVVGPNPTYNPHKPISDKNKPELECHVPMTKEGVAECPHVELVNLNPFSFKLKEGCETKVPTGMKYKNQNKEHFLGYTGECIITHGDKRAFKQLDSFLAA